MSALRRFARRPGSTTVEYAVLLAFILLVCVAAVSALAPPAGNHIEAVNTTVGTAEDP